LSTIAPPLVSSTDPTLNTPNEYSVFHVADDGTATITERYAGLKPLTRDYALALRARGMEPQAIRVANCKRAGSTDRECLDCKKWGHGSKHRCGDNFCINCSRADVRFHKWADTRDHNLFHQEHTAIEIRMPRLCRCDHCLDKTRRDWTEEFRNGLRGLATRFMKALGRDCVMADAFGEHPTDTRVRLLCPAGSMTPKKIRKAFDQLVSKEMIARGTYTDAHAIRPVCDMHQGSTADKFLWLFGGLTACTTLAAEMKAELRAITDGWRLVETIGDTYAPLPAAAVAERKAQRKKERCQCPACKSYNVRVISREERVAESIEVIEDRLPLMDWSSDTPSPLVVCRLGPTTNLENEADDLTEMDTAAYSPPT
jgi:Zn finger protein HypA/HybF involved in hydrogenase expression